MKRLWISALLLILTIILAAQTDEQTAYWRSLWPSLQEHLLLGELKVSIDPSLVVDLISQGRRNTGGSLVFGNIRLQRGGPVYELRAAGGPSMFGVSGYRTGSSGEAEFHLQEYAFIPGNGNIYTLRELLAYSRRFATIKYETVQNRVVESRQPFYSIPYPSKAGKDFVLFSDEALTQPVATIIKDANIEVLGFSQRFDSRLLIKSPGGLIGWHQLEIWSEPGSGGPPDTFFSVGGKMGYRP